MKRLIIIFSAILLLMAICLSTFSGCDTETSEEHLYNWILENGELVSGTELVYTDNNFSLHTDHSKKLFVDYTISDYKGYEITIQLPLYSESEKVKVKLSVEDEETSSSLFYYHVAKSFTINTPVEHGTINSYPPLETINLDDYGDMIYEDGKYVFHLDESKREKYEQKSKIAAEITAQRELREGIAKDLAHDSLCSILDWLSEEICPSAEMDISDLGYEAYK